MLFEISRLAFRCDYLSAVLDQIKIARYVRWEELVASECAKLRKRICAGPNSWLAYQATWLAIGSQQQSYSSNDLSYQRWGRRRWPFPVLSDLFGSLFSRCPFHLSQYITSTYIAFSQFFMVRFLVKIVE